MTATRKPPARRNQAGSTTQVADVVVREEGLPEPVRALDGEALRKAALTGQVVTLTLPIDAFLMVWERFERNAESSIVKIQPDGPVGRATLGGRLACRSAYGQVEGARTAAKQRTEKVGVRKVERRTPPRRR